MYHFLKVMILFAIIAVSNRSPAQIINKKLAAQLDSIGKLDQQYRNKEMQHSARNKEEDDANMRRQGVIDVANLARIDKIIATYGYPGRSLVGDEYKSVAFMVIQHNDLAAREKYLPVIIKAAEAGELASSSVALMIDRTLMDKGKKQLYGTQMHETKQGVKIVPIEDEANVDTRRAKLGLPPLAVYLKQWKIAYVTPGATNTNNPDIYYTPENRDRSPIELIGGNDALYSKLTYPAKAKEANISGSVTIELTVTTDGSVKNATVARSLGYGCDEEALRVMKEARFKNATGEDYEVRYKVPFPYVKRD